MVQAPEMRPQKDEIPYADFKRTVEQWKHLADMQVFRNQIDLAIEANAEGLRFCGDRDPESRVQLEKQRDLLQERKLHQQQESAEPLLGPNLEEAVSRHNDARARLDELREAKQKKNKRKRQLRKDRETKQKLEEAVSSLMAAIDEVSTVLRAEVEPEDQES